MNVIDTTFFTTFVEMLLHGDALGWHERNGGNATYWMRKDDVLQVKEQLDKGTMYYDIGIKEPYLANEYLLISATGAYFHDVGKHPSKCVGIIQLDEQGEHYRICWGFDDHGLATSEIASHVMNIAVQGRLTNGKHRILYHAHCPNIIALTFLLPLSSTIFTKQLWSMMSECAIVFQDGVGVLPWMVPGGGEIARASRALMQKHRSVIWAHHGILCSGFDTNDVFGRMHTIEKSAEIWLKIHACSAHPLQQIKDGDIRKIADSFGISLQEGIVENDTSQ